MSEIPKVDPPILVVTDAPHTDLYHKRHRRTQIPPVDSQASSMTLATWLDPHGNGYTVRTVSVEYAQIPALIAVLAYAYAQHLKVQAEPKES